jgi:hypothetical protein
MSSGSEKFYSIQGVYINTGEGLSAPISGSGYMKGSDFHFIVNIPYTYITDDPGFGHAEGHRTLLHKRGLCAWFL